MIVRSAERRVKASIIRALGALMRSARSTELPDWGGRPHRVLYLRYDRIGDMVLATGIIKAIAMAHPGITVDVLASPGNAAVLRGNPYVGAVLTFDRARPWTHPRTIARMRRARYDAVIDAMVMSPSLTTMMLMWASGARHRIGVADRGNDFALTLPVPRLAGAAHYVDHSSAVLAAFGVDPRRGASAEPDPGPVHRATPDEPEPAWGIWRPEIYLTPSEWKEAEQRWRAVDAEVAGGRTLSWRLVANVSAGAGWRYWPDAQFVTALTRIRSRFPNLSVLIIGAPEDTERMTRIGRGTGAAVAPTANYRQMMALVATADFALTADTSVTHIASAFDKPALAMFGRGRAALYGPYGTAGRTVSTAGLSLDALESDAVVAALDAMLAAGMRDEGLMASRSPDAHPHRPMPKAGAPTPPPRPPGPAPVPGVSFGA